MGLICSVNSRELTLQTTINRYQSFLGQISKQREVLAANMVSILESNGNNTDDVQYKIYENADQQLDTNQTSLENQIAYLNADLESTKKEYDNNVKDSGFSFSV